jgi:hypothetical protein
VSIIDRSVVSPGFSTNNAHHQILSKVALNTIKQIQKRLWNDNSLSWCPYHHWCC